jgi:hypothetical protein
LNKKYMAAAGKWKFYDTAKEKIGQGIIDLDGHTFKMALFTSASNCNTLTHDELADLTNQVANGNGYTTGGVTLTGVTWTNSSGTITFDFSDPSWTASGGSIVSRYAVIYDDTVAGDPLLAVCLLDTTPANVTVPNGFVMAIIISASGAFNLSGATTD